MKGIALLFCATLALGQAPAVQSPVGQPLVGQPLVGQPLQIVSVGRTGLPPYEGSQRVYRLEGNGCATLRVGEVVVLKREGELRNLGRLEITSVHLDHAQAKLLQTGDTFPLKGDLAVRMELLRAMPVLPKAVDVPPLPAVAALQPRALKAALVRSFSTGTTYREPIYFLKGDASLSPGAVAKLRAWAESWGVQTQWTLECPQPPGMLSTLLQERISALREALRASGIQHLEVRAVPPEPPGRYDAIYVMSEPW